MSLFQSLTIVISHFHGSRFFCAKKISAAVGAQYVVQTLGLQLLDTTDNYPFPFVGSAYKLTHYIRAMSYSFIIPSD